MGTVLAINCATHLWKDYELLQLDISSAFCHIQFELVNQKLKQFGVSDNLRTYIVKMLSMRYSVETGQMKCGLSQGDPLSTLIFTMCVDDVLRKLAEKYKVIGYVDDSLLGIRREGDVGSKVNEAIQFAKLEF